MLVAEFMKLLARRPPPDEREDFDHDHTLGSLARKHAVHTESFRTGTAFDWEDLERYQIELDRLDREGPGGPSTH